MPWREVPSRTVSPEALAGSRDTRVPRRPAGHGRRTGTRCSLLRWDAGRMWALGFAEKRHASSATIRAFQGALVKDQFCLLFRECRACAAGRWAEPTARVGRCLRGGAFGLGGLLLMGCW